MTEKILWSSTPGTALAGSESITSLDLVAVAMERKWGVDRLRLLVDETLRIKFDRQRTIVFGAIVNGDLAQLQTETRRMINAWHALDKAADAIPANHLPPVVWEVMLADCSVAQIVRDSEMASVAAAKAVADGRQVAIYTLEEIARILTKYPTLYPSANTVPGARVINNVPASLRDPLDGILHDA